MARWITLPCLALLAGLAIANTPAPASPADEPLRLTLTGDEPGWISLQATGPDGASVEVRELVDGRTPAVARVSLRGGTGELRHAFAWRCEPRRRRFVATTPGPGGQTATAAITTPSCHDRLKLIVVPATVRPGEAVSVRVTDTWRRGGVAASVCARAGEDAAPCTRVSLPRGTRARGLRVRLTRPGHRTIALRSSLGQRLSAAVDVRKDARLRVLVTGDSMIYGLFEALAGDLGRRGLVLGDPHPGRGITTPGFLDWPAHAQRSASVDRPDVTVVVVGAADAGYPLNLPSGLAVACCEAPWITAYARLVDGMMASYLRDGRGLVYWVLLPAPRSAAKARVLSAENDAVRQAGAAHDDGVRVVAKVADVLAPGDRFHESISVDGRTRVVRDADGIHLAAAGIRIAADIVAATLRRDGLLP